MNVFDESEDNSQKNTNIDDSCEQILSVVKYLSQPNPLMRKIQFSQYKPNQYYPKMFSLLPKCLSAQLSNVECNNMNLIEQSAFMHEKLKNDVLGFLLNNNLNKNEVKLIKKLTTLSQYYQGRLPIYQKYQTSFKYSYQATYILDMNLMAKRKGQINNNKFQKESNLVHKNHTHSYLKQNRPEFDSNFESGNLFQVYQNEHNQFDLILQNDINTKGNTQWFFYSVKNVKKGSLLKFNIINLSKSRSLFDYGMKPAVFSMIRSQKRGIGWVRQGMKVTYRQNTIKKQQSNQQYFKLSFEYKFIYDGDIVYFSYAIPYTYTDLGCYLNKILSNKSYHEIIRFKNIEFTVGGNLVDILQLTNNTISSVNKKVIWIIGRQHPGQTTSGWMFQGIIQYLLSSVDNAKYLLTNYVFKIIPMLNVDGVIHGNSRAELVGTDPNRNWKQPNPIRNPVIFAIKKEIMKDKNQIQMFLDLHSHSKKLGTFFYGNISKQGMNLAKLYPKMVSKLDSRFNEKSCRFVGGSEQTARNIIFQMTGNPFVFTVQSSLYGYQNKDRKIIAYVPKDYQQMGISLIKGIVQLKKIIGHRKNEVIQSANSPLLKEMINLYDQTNQEIDKEESEGSDSDPCEDELKQNYLKKILFKNKNFKKKLNKKKQIKPHLIKISKQQTPLMSRKTSKESYYTKYFSLKGNTTLPLRENKQKKIEVKNHGNQVDIKPINILEKSGNNSMTERIKEKTERRSLCIIGFKVEEDVTVNDRNIGVQADSDKIFTKNRSESQGQGYPRRILKLQCRPSSIIQAKQNNFLNRGNCGHLSAQRDINLLMRI